MDLTKCNGYGLCFKKVISVYSVITSSIAHRLLRPTLFWPLFHMSHEGNCGLALIKRQSHSLLHLLCFYICWSCKMELLGL